VIEAINTHQTPDLPDPRERICFTVARDVLAGQGLTAAVHADAETIMGVEDLVALVAVVGNFSMTCLTAVTFQLAPPDNDPIPLQK
jgi:4-carboxymuconolactone decarboxylase